MPKHTLIISTADLKKTDHPELSDEFLDAVYESIMKPGKFVYNALDIVELARRAERRLDKMDLTQADRVGFQATFDHKGPWAKAYKYRAVGRSVTMRRTAKGWVLVSLKEIDVYPTQPERVTYRATAKQIDEAQRRAVADLQKIAA